MNKILVVEDDPGIREMLKDILIERGFLVETLEDGSQVLDKLKKSLPDLILLDLGLPKISGESICREVHKLYPSLSIFILTAKNSTENIVNSFNIGAIDFVPKPFDTEELLARIKTRLKMVDVDTLEVDDLKMNIKKLEVTRSGKIIHLTPYEFKLLQYLLMNKGQVLSRDMILNRVWQFAYDVDSRVVDVYIGYLRKKIDRNTKKPLIVGHRGFGYSIKE